MKYLFNIVLVILTWVGVTAETRLPVMQAFDGRYDRVKGVSISIIQQTGDCYYSITVEGNKKIIRQILEMVKETEAMINDKSIDIYKVNSKTMMNIPVIVNDSHTNDCSKTNKKDRGEVSTKEPEKMESPKKSDITIVVEHKEKKPELTLFIVSQYPVSKLTIP